MKKILALVVVALVAACGGDGDGEVSDDEVVENARALEGTRDAFENIFANNRGAILTAISNEPLVTSVHEVSYDSAAERIVVHVDTELINAAGWMQFAWRLLREFATSLYEGDPAEVWAPALRVTVNEIRVTCPPEVMREIGPASDMVETFLDCDPDPAG